MTTAPAMVRDYANQPLAIGRRVIPGRLALAPMAMLTHIALRELVSDFGGCGLFFTEMCSAARLVHEKRDQSAYFKFRAAERENLVCQIVGRDPVVMAEAARRIEAEGLFGVDINFGCCAAAIRRKGAGAHLLEEPDQAQRIVAAVRNAVSLPVWAKFRVGRRDDPALSVDLARRFEAAGADALTFHPRVTPDRRCRPPRWDYIRAVKGAVTIPVFGNGNVFTADDAAAMIRLSACDGISVGRMAAARPWLFAAWARDVAPPADIHRQVILKMVDLLGEAFDPPAARRRFLKFCFYFSANFAFGHTLYRQLSGITRLSEAQPRINAFFDSAPALLPRPNPNYF